MMIIRAALTVVLVSGLLAAPLAAEAQQPGRAPVVGVLLLGPPTPTPLTAVFKEALRELGYVEYRGAEGKIDRFPALAAEEAPGLSQRRVALMREILPRAKRVAILWHPGAFGEQLGREMARDVEDGARAAGLEAQVLAAQSPDDFTGALAMMTQDGVEGQSIAFWLRAPRGPGGQR